MQPITVALTDEDIDALGEIAAQERRRPREQAAVLLADAIARRVRARNRSINAEIRDRADRSKVGR